VAKELIPPTGFVLCDPDKPDCGEPYFNGSKGGPKDTDELVCPIGGDPKCKGEECECLLCYWFRVKGEDKTYLRLPEPSLPKTTITRAMAEDIKHDVKEAARKLRLEISFGWRCVCLKNTPITGKK
jgi:hypothetical protein